MGGKSVWPKIAVCLNPALYNNGIERFAKIITSDIRYRISANATVELLGYNRRRRQNRLVTIFKNVDTSLLYTKNKSGFASYIVSTKAFCTLIRLLSVIMRIKFWFCNRKDRFVYHSSPAIHPADVGSAVYLSLGLHSYT